MKNFYNLTLLLLPFLLVFDVSKFRKLIYSMILLLYVSISYSDLFNSSIYFWFLFFQVILIFLKILNIRIQSIDSNRFYDVFGIFIAILLFGVLIVYNQNFSQDENQLREIVLNKNIILSIIPFFLYVFVVFRGKVK